MTDIVTTSWSEVDANNNQFPPEGWPAGMLPNAVEPTARMNMAALKRFWNRVNPVYLTTQGATTDSYIATPTQAIGGYGLFEKWDLRPHVQSQSTSPTLSISGFPVTPIKKYSGGSIAALAQGDIQTTRAHTFYWDGTQFILRDPATSSVQGLSIAAGKTFTVNNTLTLNGTDGTALTMPPQDASLGYLNLPYNTQVTSYTLLITDAGKTISHPAADAIARIITIPSNVAFIIGTAITLINRASQVLSVMTATAHTIILGGSTTTGTRSIAQNGVGTIIKDSSTEWIITGAGVT